MIGFYLKCDDLPKTFLEVGLQRLVKTKKQSKVRLTVPIPQVEWAPLGVIVWQAAMVAASQVGSCWWSFLWWDVFGLVASASKSEACWDDNFPYLQKMMSK